MPERLEFFVSKIFIYILALKKNVEYCFRIPLASENLGTYLCFVNNTVGLGAPCEIDLQGIGVLKNISDTNVIVIVAVIAAALVAAIILGTDLFNLDTHAYTDLYLHQEKNSS